MVSKLRRAAYAKVARKPGLINAGARVGTKIVQLVYIRPGVYGYDLGRGKR